MFEDALAVNWIKSPTIKVTAADQTGMLLNDWAGFDKNGSYPGQTPYMWELTLPLENGNSAMVPASSISCNLTNLSGLAGQNTTPPSEKFFGVHYLASAGSTYYDPS
jgi:hypothetical protein